MTHQVNIIGHRGYTSAYPENSLIGFKKAAELGVDGIELDVHLTKDGELIVIHDETIDRVTNGSGWIHQMTFDQIRTYRLKDVKGRTFLDEPIPTLREVLEVMDAYRHVSINIELKTHIVLYEQIEKKVLELVATFNRERDIVYSSFHFPTLIRIKRLDEHARVAFLVNRLIPQLHDYVTTFELEGLHLKKNVYFGNEHLFEKSGNVRIWTISKKRDLIRLLKSNIAAIITKNPEKALAIRGDIERSKI